MTDPDDRGFHFERLCRAFRTEYDRRGFSQSRLKENGGPAGPTITELYNGTWTSARPKGVCDKIDKGFGWEPETAWMILIGWPDQGSAGPDRVDEILLEIDQMLEHRRTVGGGTHDGGQYVESSTGKLVESGVTNEDLLREILRNRAESDQIRAEVRELSERMAKLEQQGP